MSTASLAERVTLPQLLWISACLGLALLAQVATLPLWVTLTVAAVAALRVALAVRGREAPPRPLRLIVSVLAIGLLFAQFRTFNGLSAGTALLSLIAGLKLMETQTRRDLYVITMIIYFLSLAALIEDESFWLLSYLVGVCWLSITTLLRLTSSSSAGTWRSSLRYSGRILAQALPLAIAFWLFFPRFGGPLWQLPQDGGSATTGLSDSMSPGDITDLANSDDVAFRVRFSAGTPPSQERYWRGPVLHDFDGRTWRRTESGPMRTSTRVFDGPAYQYTVSLEPNQHNWIFALDYPSHTNAATAFLTSDFMLEQPTPIAQPLDVIVTSYSHSHDPGPLRTTMRDRDLRMPPGRNPRSVRLARELRAAHPDEMDYLHAVLQMFRDQPFYYTLTPPRLAADTVDGFLFDTRRGFCGHYASAFAALMRAAGIPARVVTGYHGGTYNRFADYWIVRQSDAHAWDEVWIEGHGWLRIDPTSMVAPERVERGLNDLAVPGEASASRWQQRTPAWLRDTRLRVDALRLLWRQRILTFDQDSQMRLLAWLHIPQPDGQKLALVLAGCLISGMLWLTWQVRRDLSIRRRDPVTRAYDRLCKRLAAVGLVRLPHEGPEAFAARVAVQRPDLGAAVIDLCRRYSDLTYADMRRDDRRAERDGQRRHALPAANAAFIAGVRAFRPRGSRASS